MAGEGVIELGDLPSPAFDAARIHMPAGAPSPESPLPSNLASRCETGGRLHHSPSITCRQSQRAAEMLEISRAHCRPHRRIARETKTTTPGS